MTRRRNVAKLSEMCTRYSSGDLEELSSQLLQSLYQSKNGDTPEVLQRFGAGDAVLITYADTVVDAGRSGLQSLRGLVNGHLKDFAAVIHVLPFLKSPVMAVCCGHHDQLEERHGDWNDLSALARDVG